MINSKMIGAALALALTLSACTEGRIGIVNGIYPPPSAQCGGNQTLYRITVDPDGHEGKSIDERAKLRKEFCVSPEKASKYRTGGVYP